MKDYLKRLIKRRKEELKNAEEKMKASEDIEEVRSLGDTLISLRDEIADAEEQLAKLEEDEGKENDDDSTTEGNNGESEDNSDEGRSAFNPNLAVAVASTKMNSQARGVEEPRASMEYRTAFKDYIQRGIINKDVLQFEKRDDATGTSSDLGVLIPTTVIQEIIKDVEKVYGQLYSRVRKLNVKGGVEFPIGSFSATFHRISETTVSDRQKGGTITGSVSFKYKIGEIKLARTLLQTILSVPVFEQEFAKVIAEAYVKAMDTEIMTGTEADSQCVGILTEADSESSRIPTTNVISFTEEEMADWKSWQTKLFATIPLSMRGLNPEFVMTANTYEANIKTLADDNNRPVYNETFNPVDGAEISRFKGKNVVFVEEDILANFNDAGDGEYFGMYWVPEKAYAINSNMEFTVVDYFDHDKNQYVKKALVVNDGKVLDPKYIYLLKKSVSA